LRKKLKLLVNLSEKIAPMFKKGGKFERFFPLYEATETFIISTAQRTVRGPHIRDHFDVKRYMTFVVLALVPATLFGAYNVGYQAFMAQGISAGLWQCFWSGFLTILPIILVSYIAGGFWEVLFAIVRKHEINEGFFVTGILFALVLPPTIPLWQVAVAISFGVVIGKEVFGGTGMNVLNPALTARAFIFFAFPGKISGDKVWTAIDVAKDKLIDGFSGATPLLVASSTEAGKSVTDAVAAAGFTFEKLFYGLVPGSIGETSTLAILLGAFFLLITGIASWRIILAVFIGGIGTSFLLNLAAGSASPAILTLPPLWHMVMGGFAFGAIFMATDPVSAASTDTGKWIYGILIGVMAILIRAINPAYPEGMMLAILLLNVFAPLIDYYVVRANIRRRLNRA
jgi:Na+-transporting NADH:ubiquinone oxidoreductase subunit B